MCRRGRGREGGREREREREMKEKDEKEQKKGERRGESQGNNFRWHTSDSNGRAFLLELSPECSSLFRLRLKEDIMYTTL